MRLVFLAFIFSLCFIASCKKQHSDIDDPDAKIANGWVEFRLGEYKKAIQIFESVGKNPKVAKEPRLKALYGLACSHWQKLPDADKPLAKKIFNQIINEDPASEYAAWSELALIRMEHIVAAGEKPDYQELRKRYKVLYEKFPSSIAGHEGFIYMASTYVASMGNEKDFKKGLELIDEFIQKHPHSQFISSAWTLKAKICEVLERPEEMLDALIKALDTVELDPTNPQMDNSGRYWEIAAKAEFVLGNFEVAKKYYRRLIEEYPRDRRRFAAIKAIERMDKLCQEFEKEEKQ